MLGSCVINKAFGLTGYIKATFLLKFRTGWLFLHRVCLKVACWMALEEVVEETWGANAGRGDLAFLGDLSHQLAHRFLAPWRCSFLGF